MNQQELPTPGTIGALLDAAELATSPAVERATGLLLGADADSAAGAVEALRSAGRLPDGLAVCALVLASRRGIDAAAAIAELAGGRAVPTGWSDYELRAAGEEAADERTSGVLPPGDGQPVVAMGSDAPAAVVGALRAGTSAAVTLGAAVAHHEDGLSLLRAVVDHRWAARLAADVGWVVRPRPGPTEAAALQALLDSGQRRAPVPPGAGRGEHHVWRRSLAHLDLAT